MKYRRAVVEDNIRQAFPDKTDDAVKVICKSFYRNFADQWIETIKLMSISTVDLNNRITANWEIFDKLHFDHKKCYALMGHMFNWEWISVVWQENIRQQYACFYKPIANKGFDRVMYRIRTRAGALLISTKAKRELQKLNSIPFVLGLAADQNPTELKHAIWKEFMHREAPFFKGPEKMARNDKAAVIFVAIVKEGRGKYRVDFELITENAATLPEGELTNNYVDFLQTRLSDQPENWLWSHRRWRHTRQG